MIFQSEIKRELSADVVVIGGGTAGVFAAIAAAKTGAKTLLIEKSSILGGTITVANVNFPGLFFAWGKQIIGGPCWESIERTIKLGGAKMPEIIFKPERHWYEQIRLNKFIYTSILFQMCIEAGVEVICNAMISAAAENNNGIQITATDKSGLFAVNAQTAIDATGDANLVQISGYPVAKSPVQQPATLQNHISGYKACDISLEDIKDKFKAGCIPEYVTPEKLIDYLNIYKLDIHTQCRNADTSKGKTETDRQALFDIMQIYNFLRTVNGLENLQIDFCADEAGIRESCRIIGETVVTAEEYISGHFYPDSICNAFYPIDLHVMDGIKKTYHKENVVAKIPYSALIPKNSAYILCAGRCISSDVYANSGLRVQASCMAAGQAAGCAAAIASKNKTKAKDVNYQELCTALKAINAIVPEK